MGEDHITSKADEATSIILTWKLSHNPKLNIPMHRCPRLIRGSRTSGHNTTISFYNKCRRKQRHHNHAISPITIISKLILTMVNEMMAEWTVKIKVHPRRGCTFLEKLVECASLVQYGSEAATQSTIKDANALLPILYLSSGYKMA